MKIESKIEEYFKHNPKLQKPLSFIAHDIGCSIATVHRAIKSLERKKIIKVSKSRLKTEADTIYYLGSPGELSPSINEFMKSVTELSMLAEDLVRQLAEKQRMISDLENALTQYKELEERIISRTITKDGLEVILIRDK